MENVIAGASPSASFVSCIRRMSGFARSSHQSTFSWRALSELTFQVAIRTVGSGRSVVALGVGSAAEHVGPQVADAHPFGSVADGLVVLLVRQLQGREGLARLHGVRRREH